MVPRISVPARKRIFLYALVLILGFPFQGHASDPVKFIKALSHFLALRRILKNMCFTLICTSAMCFLLSLFFFFLLYPNMSFAAT